MRELDFESARYIHSLINIDYPESRIDASNFIIKEITGADAIAKLTKGKKECLNLGTANLIMRHVLKVVLETDNYLLGATLCWGTTLFDYRPRSVRLIWEGMQNRPQLLIFGGGSQGKSYTAIVFSLLDWERDPEGTTTKLASTTAGHERANTFSNLVRLHRNSAIPLSGFIRQGFIGLDKDDRRSSISEVTIDKGDENKSGKLQGFHPLPRRYPHPKFGNLTRVRGVFDEVEDVPIGLWKGESNMMVNLDDEMHVSIVAMWNPKVKDSMAAQKSEPEGGWLNLDESVEKYTSRAGYDCIRLDPRKSENVLQRKKVYEGFLTWEGYKLLEERGGADYRTFGCGLYPLEVAAFGIIDPILLEKRRGVYLWLNTPTAISALDMAEEGGDLAEFTEFKYGKAYAWVPEGGEPEKFPKPRWCVQVEQQFPMQKKNTILMGADAINMNHELHVKPEWFALDASNTVTLRDWMRLKWGNILGIKWGEAATEVSILEEIREMASDLYDNVKTEMWFAFAAWVEFGYVGFSPAMDTTELFTELAGMRYKPISKTKKRCEDTREFKKRFQGKSPDKASSCIMGVHIVRQRSPQIQRPKMEPGVERPTGEDYSGESIVFTEESAVEDAIKWV